jgi:hypothetical protein
MQGKPRIPPRMRTLRALGIDPNPSSSLAVLSGSLAVGKPSAYDRSSSTGSAPAALFTGSGVVEAGCKAVKGQRCREAGNLGRTARRAEVSNNCYTIAL